MSRSTVVSIDAMGGDRGPDAILSGMAHALAARPDLHFVLHGDEATLAPLLARRSDLAGRCDLHHAAGVISMSEKPSRALRDGRESSMWKALETVARGEARVAVSCGNTGALMAMAIMVLRKAPGIDRPAIAVNWPARVAHGFNTVLDMGADVRADSRNLLQFAAMGAEYAHLSFGIARPRVGLLNVGTEPSKGPEALRDAAALLAAAGSERFEFVGFVEGSDICQDTADVFVTDGFTGNVALKTAEGTASFIGEALRNAFHNSLWSKIAALFAATSLRRMRERFDPRRMNGGVFLGLNGAVVKSHGSADAIGFASAIELAAKMAETDFPHLVAAELARLDARDRTAAEEAPEGTGGTSGTSAGDAGKGAGE